MTKPNFFLVGAAKAGTTSLWQYLSGHPDIFMTQTAKEPHYFLWADEENDFDLGDWKRVEKPFHSDWQSYLELFNDANEIAVGEASVFYLAHPGAPEKIQRKCPESKILIALRDPYDRAFSWYLFNQMRHEETSPTFVEAVRRELSRTNPYYANQYIGLGLYAEQVKRYLDVFGKDNVHIILFENLVKNPSDECKKVFEFLGVRSDVPIETDRIFNPTVSRHPVLDQIFRLKASDGALGKFARAVHGKFSGSKPYLALKQVAFDWADKKASSGNSQVPDRKSPNAEEIALLKPHFEADIFKLEQSTGMNLSSWKKQDY